jgi:hypothetical protein
MERQFFSRRLTAPAGKQVCGELLKPTGYREPSRLCWLPRSGLSGGVPIDIDLIEIEIELLPVAARITVPDANAAQRQLTGGTGQPPAVRHDDLGVSLWRRALIDVPDEIAAKSEAAFTGGDIALTLSEGPAAG